MGRDTEHTATGDIGNRLRQARRALGKSRAQLAATSGVSRREIAALEAGRSSASEADLHALADACGVEIGALAPPTLRLAVAAHALSDQAGIPLEGDAARDVLLREYVAMLVELRGSPDVPASSLRQDDLAELARVAGGSPDVIEARLTQLLQTTDAGIHPGP